MVPEGFELKVGVYKATLKYFCCEMLSNEEKRARIIRIIAATRFPFIDQEDWPADYVTVVNDNVNRRSVVGPEGRVYPSIMVVDGNGDVREIGQVELDESYTLAHVDVWSLLSTKASAKDGSSRFFLFVPEGRGRMVQKLLEENGINYAGIRTWTIRQGQLVVRAYKTANAAGEPSPVKLIRKKYMRTEDGMKIYLIDGEYFRDNLDIDFTVGGHHWVYPFIPRDEVWLDEAYTTEPKEVEYFIAHELEELKHMKKGMRYEDAHALANKLEKELREKIDRRMAEGKETEQG